MCIEESTFVSKRRQIEECCYYEEAETSSDLCMMASGSFIYLSSINLLTERHTSSLATPSLPMRASPFVGILSLDYRWRSTVYASTYRNDLSSNRQKLKIVHQ